MVAKKKVVAKKGKITAFKQSDKPSFKKGFQKGSKNGKQDPEEQSMSKSKLKKKEYQAKRYNKKTKKQTEEEEDSDFEVVPNKANKPTTFSGNDATLEFDHSSEDDDSEDEQAVDMFGAVSSKGPNFSMHDTGDLKDDEDDTNNPSEDSDDEETKFIAAENASANRKKKKSGGFQSMGLSQNVFKAIAHKGFKVPTPIQRKCIPIIMEGDDVVGMARTGSGKTAAFLIPMLEKLKTHSAKVGARAIVLSPSRELALQTQKVVKELGKYTDLRSCIIVGGDSLEEQFSMIASNPDIIIATPGRLLHLIVEMSLDIKTVEYVVFDEADRLFEMGFAVQLHEILSRLPQSRQTLLFSATLPKLLVDFAKAGLQDPTLVRLDVDTKISKDLEMAFFTVKQQEKEAALLYILRNVIKLSKSTLFANQSTGDKKKKFKKPPKMEDLHQTIVFASTKHHVDYLANLLTLVGYQVSYVYGTLDQTARLIQINNFRNGITNILIVTDVAARGIDIPILENVINYDFVDSSKVFIHRVGRAARAGRRGWAYSIITPEELPYLLDLQLFLSRRLLCGTTEAKQEGSDYTSDLVLGALPRELIDDDSEWVRSRVADDAELTGYMQTAINGYKLFCKTRPSAAAESYARAKQLLKNNQYHEPHPLVADHLNNTSQESRNALLSSITNFRPQETIFEVGQRGTKKTSEATLVMRSRRKAVAKVIDAHKINQANNAAILKLKANGNDGSIDEGIEEHVNLGGDVGDEELKATFKMTDETGKQQSNTPKGKKTTNFKDEEFYLSYTQADANTEKGYSMNTSGNFVEQAAKASLDLVGDERDTMTQKKNQLRWDAKKKNFVQGTGIGSDNKKMIRTESGTLISASFKSGRFDDWAKKTKLSLPRNGEQELSTAKNLMAQKRYKHNAAKEAKPLDPLAHDYENKLKKRKRQEENEPTPEVRQGKKGKLGVKRVGNSKNARNELRGTDQIRKERADKQKRREKNARPTKKGKKGGRR